MWEVLDELFGGQFMPHGHCYLWSPTMVWLQVVSNLLIGIAYVSISSTLYFIIRRIKDIPFSWMYLAFGIFIITCGATHLLDVVTVWHPVYWLDGGLRAITAVASVGTALLLFPLVPKAIGLAQAAHLAHERGEKLEATYKELAHAHERAKEVERLKTEFFANVSHELRTPLALVLGPAEKLLGAGNLENGQRRDIEVIVRNARTLLKHVNDLLDVAKLEAGKLAVDYTRADLARTVRLVSANFDSLADDRGMTFKVEAPERLEATFDPDKVERVVLNLLSNAFKFTPDAGTVRVSVDKMCTAEPTDPPQVRIEVADSGPGVREAVRERIFGRFEQGEGGRARPFGGTGLGLAIAREFVELQHGTLEVLGAPEGGALFRVILPTTAPEGADVREAPNSGTSLAERLGIPQGSSHAAGLVVDELRMAAGGGVPRATASSSTTEGEDLRPSVLVVEDNREMNAFIAESLGPRYRVAQAFDGESGLTRAIELRPDAILSDVMMPKMTGDELVREVRKNAALDNVPIILITAEADDEVRAKALRQGAQDYLTKPFSAEELRARVENLVTTKRVRDVLENELSSHAQNLESAALELRAKKHELETALDTVRVARDHAERASQLKTSFLGMVSHELRTPLTSLQLLLDRLMSDGGAELSPRQTQILERMSASTGRLTDLVDSLLHYARIQSGKLTTEVERFDIRNVASAASEELRPMAQRKKLSLEVELPSTPVAVNSDPKLLRLVIVNLVSNAVKFTERGVVVVSVLTDVDMRVIRVRDTGPGIPAGEADRIFEPFEQLGNARQKHLPGVGLGLSLAREIVNNLGGTIIVRSEVGQGSTFDVLLPAPSSEQ